MNDALSLVLALATGVLLGAIFFGGLWWTVCQSISSKQPALLFFGSLSLRTGVALAGFYLIGRADWERLPISLLGFVMARLIATRLTRSAEKPTYWAPEARHAPYSR